MHATTHHPPHQQQPGDGQQQQPEDDDAQQAGAAAASGDEEQQYEDAGAYYEDGGEGAYYYGEEGEIDYSRPFPAEVPMDANTRMLASVPLPLYYPAVIALAAAGGFVGYSIGGGAPVEPAQRPAVAAAVGAAVAGAIVYGGVRVSRPGGGGAVGKGVDLGARRACSEGQTRRDANDQPNLNHRSKRRQRQRQRQQRQAKKTRDRAAAVDLFNQLVWMDDPAELTPEDVKAAGDR